VRRIDLSGLSPEMQQRVANHLTVREGDTLKLVNVDRIRADLQQAVDEHLAVGMRVTANSDSQPADMVLTIFLPGSSVPQAIRVGGGATPVPIVRVEPVYPPTARLARIQGIVQTSVIVGPDRKVQDVQFVSGPAMLAQAAIDAIWKWVYQPLLMNGQPATVRTTATVNFTLE